MNDHTRYCHVIAAISALEYDARRRGGRYRTFKNGCEAFEFAFNSRLGNPDAVGALIMEFGGSVFSLCIERERLRKLIDGSAA